MAQVFSTKLESTPDFKVLQGHFRGVYRLFTIKIKDNELYLAFVNVKESILPVDVVLK